MIPRVYPKQYQKVATEYFDKDHISVDKYKIKVTPGTVYTLSTGFKVKRDGTFVLKEIVISFSEKSYPKEIYELMKQNEQV